MDETTGALLIPGGHNVLSAAVREGKPVGKLLPAINLDAQTGTMVITDGRLLRQHRYRHTKTNLKSCAQRYAKVLDASAKRNWMLSVDRSA